MTKLPIDLPLKTMTTKVSVAAHQRLKALATKHNARMSDVLSACLLHLPEGVLVELLERQKDMVGKLPRVVRGMLTNVDKLSPAVRALLRDILSLSPSKKALASLCVCR